MVCATPVPTSTPEVLQRPCLLTSLCCYSRLLCTLLLQRCDVLPPLLLLFPPAAAGPFSMEPTCPSCRLVPVVLRAQCHGRAGAQVNPFRPCAHREASGRCLARHEREAVICVCLLRVPRVVGMLVHLPTTLRIVLRCSDCV